MGRLSIGSIVSGSLYLVQTKHPVKNPPIDGYCFCSHAHQLGGRVLKLFYYSSWENSHQDTKTQSNTKGVIINESFVSSCLCGNNFYSLPGEACIMGNSKKTRKKMKKKSLRYTLGILITVLALWLSFRNLDWVTLKQSISRVNMNWVILAVLTVLFSVYIVGWRWQILLRSKAHIPLSDMFRFTIISQYVNIIIPARFGELLKAWLAARKYSLSGSYVLGTILIEKIIEYFLVFILAVLAPVLFTFQTKLKGQTIAMVIFLILISLLILAIWKRVLVREWLARLANVFPVKLKERILNFLEKGMEAFTLLKDFKMIFQVVVITLIVIFSQVITNLILFRAYGFKLSLFEALILQLALLIGMALPSVPGKIGIFEYTVLLVLSRFGIEKSIALSYGLMLHVIAYLPKILLGFVFTANLNISLKKAGKEIEWNELKNNTRIKPNPGNGDEEGR